jgi:beta-galactosidase
VQATKSSLYCDVELWKQVPDQWGEAGVKRANGCKKYFIEDPTRPVTVGMDQVKATMESGFGACWIFLD